MIIPIAFDSFEPSKNPYIKSKGLNRMHINSKMFITAKISVRKAKVGRIFVSKIKVKPANPPVISAFRSHLSGLSSCDNLIASKWLNA